MFKLSLNRRSRLCLILYFSLFLQSCFRVGIPERFYSYELENPSTRFRSLRTGDPSTHFLSTGHPSSSPKIFISIPSRNDTYGIKGDKSGDNLGHQFVLGILPLTSLYLDHGVKSFYLESLIQHLHSIGVSPIIVSDKLAKELNYPWIKFNAESTLGISVYDLIFSRLISFSGEAKIEDSLGGLTPIEIDSIELYAQAQYPLLAHLLQLSITSAFVEADFNQLLRVYKNAVAIKDSKALLLTFPEVKEIRLEVLNHFAKTYGDSLGVFTSSMLARIAQRGAELALERVGEPVALASNFSDYKGLEHLTRIEADLVELKISDQLELTVDYKFTINGVSKSYRCFVSEMIDNSRDGALVSTLEQSMFDSLNALILKKPKVCESK